MKLNVEGSRLDAADLVVVDGAAPLPLLEPDAAPAPVVILEPLAVVEADVLAELVTGRKRSVAAWVLQFDEEGTRGWYGGGVFKGSGIDHVETTPLVV